MRRFVLVTVGFLLILISCGAPSYMITKNERPQVKALPDKSLLVIIRQVKYSLPTITAHYLDANMIGQTGGTKGYFISEVNPGVHHVMVKAENIGVARFNFEAGKVYYLSQYVYPGAWKPIRSGYDPISPQEAEEQIADCTFQAFSPGEAVSRMDPKEYKGAVEEFEKKVNSNQDEIKKIIEYKGH